MRLRRKNIFPTFLSDKVIFKKNKTSIVLFNKILIRKNMFLKRKNIYLFKKSIFFIYFVILGTFLDQIIDIKNIFETNDKRRTFFFFHII